VTLPRTPSQTVGPFFAVQLPLERPAAEVTVEGRVFDGAGEALPDALVETWDGATFSRCATDAEGRWRVGVGRDVPYAAVSVFARGLLQRAVTRIYFDEGALADASGVPEDRRRTLLAEREGDGYRFDVHLQGEHETVFFVV
jgi:protocatechuate 3,4-dioxygenase, alpha subunit